MNSYFTMRHNCPTCGVEQSTEIYRVSYTSSIMREYLDGFYKSQGSGVEYTYLEDQDFIVRKCKECCTLFQSEIADNKLLQRLYDIWIHPKTLFSTVETKRRAGYFKSITDEIIHITSLYDKPLSELKMLDFSMGWANWCRVAAAFGIDVGGTEFSKTRLDHAHRVGVKVIKFRDIAKNQYDFINTEQVVEHLPQPVEDLKVLAGALKRGGILKISVPNGSCVHKIIGDEGWGRGKDSTKSLNPIAPLEHINCFDENAVIRLASRVGLKPLSVNSYTRYSICDRVTGYARPFYGALRSLDFNCFDVRRRPAIRLFFGKMT